MKTTRRDLLKKAAYVSPLIFSLKAQPQLAATGSGKAYRLPEEPPLESHDFNSGCGKVNHGKR